MCVCVCTWTRSGHVGFELYFETTATTEHKLKCKAHCTQDRTRTSGTSSRKNTFSKWVRPLLATNPLRTHTPTHPDALLTWLVLLTLLRCDGTLPLQVGHPGCYGITHAWHQSTPHWVRHRLAELWRSLSHQCSSPVGERTAC